MGESIRVLYVSRRADRLIIPDSMGVSPNLHGVAIQKRN